MINSITEIITNKGIKLTVGKSYILDKNHRGGFKIVLVGIYGKLFCRIKTPDNLSEWDTMTNRLSEIE